MGPPQELPPPKATVGRVVPLAGAEVPPVPGIFQPCYQLTEAEFFAVRNPSVFWVGLGSVLATFAVGSGLDKINDWLKAGVPIKLGDLWFPSGIILLVGLFCFAVSYVLSGDRRAL